MVSDESFQQRRDAEETWRSQFERICHRFGVKPEEYRRTTHSGIPLKPVYFRHDAEQIGLSGSEAPGQYPYTRGLYATQYQFMPWANQPVIGCGLPEHTRERMDYLASQGMVGYFGSRFYNLVYDLVAHEGLDPDHPAARGRVGQCGMAVYSKRDMATLFEGLDLTQMNVVHITYYQTHPTFAQYLAYAEEGGVPWEKLRGNTMNWYHQAAYVGMSCFPPRSALKLAVQLIHFCSRRMPQWNTTNFFGYGVEEAGATAAQEVGLMLAAGAAYTEACMRAGLQPDEFLPRFGFQIAQANDFFEEICKVRALRKLWATQNRERFGAKDPRSMHVRIHTHTSGAVLTRQQPLNNLIRATLHTLGAALAGVQAMEVCGYDEAIAIPTEEAATLALRSQQIIQEETNVAAVSDPLGGSYYVESLTQLVGAAALEVQRTVEEAGGYVRAWESGLVRSMVEQSAYEWREAVNRGERVVVGVNKYVTEKEPPVPVFSVNPEVERIAVERVQHLRTERDQPRWKAAMEAVHREARAFSAKEIEDLDGDYGLIEALVEAARADATVGELMGVLKEHLGWGSAY
ncbi:MAG: acyl-CoA mutase large subunit family protein [Candidatus Methylomirabilia bacterium]